MWGEGCFNKSLSDVTVITSIFIHFHWEVLGLCDLFFAPNLLVSNTMLEFNLVGLKTFFPEV